MRKRINLKKIRFENKFESDVRKYMRAQCLFAISALLYVLCLILYASSRSWIFIVLMLVAVIGVAVFQFISYALSYAIWRNK